MTDPGLQEPGVPLEAVIQQFRRGCFDYRAWKDTFFSQDYQESECRWLFASMFVMFLDGLFTPEGEAAFMAALEAGFLAAH
ncbi:MAG: hypothetical protein KKB13_05620 [Chloroflexi bacterium]|nr:hypothetical protein [Chloroflexota bacterium]